MITDSVFKDFEALWKRRGIFHVDLSYGQALAQYTKCTREDSASSFLCNAPYREVKAWVEETIHANSKIQVEAADNPSVKTPHKNSD